MALDQSTRSRRALLATAASGAAAMAIGAATRPLATRAALNDPVLAGAANSAPATTSLSATTDSSPDVTALDTIGVGNGAGVTGVSPRGYGVLGVTGDTSVAAYSGTDVGVNGRGNGADALAGVAGDSDSGYGVLGTSGLVGVHGAGSTVGVMATGFDPTATALYALSDGFPLPAPTANTTAHLRRPLSTAGSALFVDGRMRLRLSGRVRVSAGASSKKISVAGMTSSTMVFAIFQSNESGVWVRAAVPASGSITFYLSKALPTSAVLAWMAVG